MLRQQIAAVFVVLVVASGVGAPTAAGQTARLRGKKVLPKVNYVVKVGDMVVEDFATAGRKSLSLPWVVQAVNGTWLWVGDSHKGWVQRSDVVTLDEATDYYSSLIDRGEQRTWAYNLRAIAWKEKGELDLAIADYGEMLKLKPNAITYNNRGLAWRAKKDYDKAIADYNQAIRLNPSYTTAYNNRGNAWRDKEDYDKAIADYSEAIRLDPNNAMAYNNRGRAWSSKKEFDKAIEDFDGAIHLDPNDALAYIDRGSAWHYKQQYEKSIADYDLALQVDSTNVLAYLERGNIWSEIKEYDKAIDDYKRAIHVDPSDAAGYNALAWLQATCPDPHYRNGQSAVKMATKACDLTAWAVANNIDTLATAYAEAGQFDNAARQQQRAIELNSSDADFVKVANQRLELYRQGRPYHMVDSWATPGGTESR